MCQSEAKISINERTDAGKPGISRAMSCPAGSAMGPATEGPTRRQRKRWGGSRKGQVKESSYSRYETTLEKHIKPQLGGCLPLSQNTQLVDAFCQTLLGEERLSPQTVRGILVILKAILHYTAKQFPAGFPSIEVRYPKETKKEMRVLTPEEQ